MSTTTCHKGIGSEASLTPCEYCNEEIENNNPPGYRAAHASCYLIEEENDNSLPQGDEDEKG